MRAPVFVPCQLPPVDVRKRQIHQLLQANGAVMVNGPLIQAIPIVLDYFVHHVHDVVVVWDANGRTTILECRAGSTVAYTTPKILKTAPLLSRVVGRLMRDSYIAVTKLNVTRDE